MESMDNERMLRSIQKELKVTRLCCVLSLLLTLCLTVGAVMIYREVQPMLELAEQLEPALEMIDDLEPLLEQLKALDTAQLNTLLEEAQPVLEQLSEIDTDAINDFLENFDPEELQQTLDSLSNAMDTVNSVSDKLSGWSSLFK